MFRMSIVASQIGSLCVASSVDPTTPALSRGGPPPRSGEENGAVASPSPPRNGEGDRAQHGGGVGDVRDKLGEELRRAYRFPANCRSTSSIAWLIAASTDM